MSFAGTPLGQGRRLDHSAFLGKPPSTSALPPSSYAYGAPTLGSRSPPKPQSPSRDRSRTDEDENENDSALSRFARIKQRESAKDLAARPGGPKIITSPPKPEKWSVKDTSVNIATAFIQAAEDMSTIHNHNNAWASTSRAPAVVPRSTSVEYEAAAPQTLNRRLPAPPDKHGRPTNPPTRKPPSKSTSFRHVPDSEGEEDHSGAQARGKSPFENGLKFAKEALGAAAYYVRHRSREPEEPSMEQPQRSVNGSTNGHDSSYDYAAEEQAYQAQKRTAAANRRGRISVDNKAYKPPRESEDEESEYSDDGKTKRRRKKMKKGPAGGPLSTLPVVAADKRRRRKGRGSKGNVLDDEDESESEEADNQSQSNTHTSQPPQSRPLPSRHSQEPSQHDIDNSMLSAEQGLHSIPEVDETHLLEATQQQSHQRRAGSRGRSRTPAPQTPPSHFSIGGLLGNIVHAAYKLILLLCSGILSTVSMITFLVGQVFGTTFDLLLRRPAGWARGVGTLLKYVIPALILLGGWYVLQDASLREYVPSLSFPSRGPRYTAPDVPPADIAELTERLLRIETAIKGLSVDSERTKIKAEDGVKSFSDLQSRLRSLEGRIVAETKKVQDAEAKARDTFSKSINGVKQEVEILQSQVATQRKQQENAPKPVPADASDEEARARLRSLEERVGGVEGGIKDALEQIAKKPAPSTNAPATGPAWWNKIASSVGSLKSSDGQDVTAVISHLVHTAVSTMSKDRIAKADYALLSGGAKVIPSLTSPTLEIRPKGLARQVVGLVTGSGYAVGWPPAMALNPDIHNGHCWPFAGAEGQLGVALAAPAVVEEVTIDHIASELAYDIRSAPREMEVWGMVEGKDNIDRLKAWREDLAARKEAGDPSAKAYDVDAVAYPRTLPKYPEYIRLANFTYDVSGPGAEYVQTFEVDPEVRSLGMDFGIVVLRVLSNWGMDEFTCLYRFRVHGQRLGGVLPPVAAGMEDVPSP